MLFVCMLIGFVRTTHNSRGGVMFEFHISARPIARLGVDRTHKDEQLCKITGSKICWLVKRNIIFKNCFFNLSIWSRNLQLEVAVFKRLNKIFGKCPLIISLHHLLIMYGWMMKFIYHLPPAQRNLYSSPVLLTLTYLACIKIVISLGWHTSILISIG